MLGQKVGMSTFMGVFSGVDRGLPIFQDCPPAGSLHLVASASAGPSPGDSMLNALGQYLGEQAFDEASPSLATKGNGGKFLRNLVVIESWESLVVMDSSSPSEASGDACEDSGDLVRSGESKASLDPASSEESL